MPKKRRNKSPTAKELKRIKAIKIKNAYDQELLQKYRQAEELRAYDSGGVQVMPCGG